MKTYKVSVEYYIKAKDKEEAQDFVVDEFASGDFFERHIIIDEANLPDGEEHFNEEDEE